MESAESSGSPTGGQPAGPQLDKGAPKGGNTKKYVFMVVFPFVLVMMLVGIYAGSMHAPTPRDLPVAVTGNAAQAQTLADSLNATEGSPVEVRVVATADEARQLVHDREIAGALALPAAGSGDDAVLYSAQAAGAAQVQMVQSVFQPVADAQHLTLEHKDIAPLPASDGMGVTTLFTAIGWMLAGYMLVTVLTSGAPELLPLRRLVPLLAGWSALVSALVWVIVGPLIGAIDGHVLPVLGLGWLSVFAVGLGQTLFARLLGPLAVVPGIALFMFLGVPASNIMMSIHSVPGFFGFLHQVLPLPAAGETLRSILYFGGDGVGPHLLVLAAWAVVALALTAGVDLLRRRKSSGPDEAADTPSTSSATAPGTQGALTSA